MLSHSQNCGGRFSFSIATEEARESIYRLRHEIYARELGQHAENAHEALRDRLDDVNVYIVAECHGELAGFVSITPPDRGSYSIDKYIGRADLPFPCDDGLYEVRILTVTEPYRGTPLAGLLMYAALRWVDARNGTRVVAIGRREVLSVYRKAGLQLLGRPIQSGAVSFELMSATVRDLCLRAEQYDRALQRLRRRIDWQLDVPFLPRDACVHGGQFFDDIGTDFCEIDRRHRIINADVLDAWYPPAPVVLAALEEHLAWIVRTSPPTHCDGMIQAIAEARRIPDDRIVVGAGSSDLIFAAFREWLSPKSRALILDPTYGEYPHVLENVIGCRVDRFPVHRCDDYQPDLDELERFARRQYDLIVLVNPNSPTGRHIPRSELQRVLQRVPSTTRVWIDETYVDYAGRDETLEPFASRSRNVVVCKSMSKVYALSGVRAAYLCAPRSLTQQLRHISRPWTVSLPGQIAAVTALRNPRYYELRRRETHALRNQLAGALEELGLDVVPGVANFLLCHLPVDGPDAAAVCAGCRRDGLFLRDVSMLSPQLGGHAIRIAVKDLETNRRIVEILQRVLVSESTERKVKSQETRVKSRSQGSLQETRDERLLALPAES